jgi:hypothetical protein
MSTQCPVCRDALPYGARGDPSLEGTCSERCYAEFVHRTRARHTALAAERQAVAEDLAAGFDTPVGRSVVALALPVNTARVTLLPRERADEVLDFAQRLVAEAFRLPPLVDQVEPEGDVSTGGSVGSAPFAPTRAWTADLCRACRGRCCRDGAERGAFLSLGMFRRLRAMRPDLDADALFAIYASAIPTDALDGGCVFQAAHGCTLPREFRATICNDFYCPSFKRAAALVDESGADEAVASGFENTDPFPSRVVRVGEGVFEVLTEIPDV